MIFRWIANKRTKEGRDKTKLILKNTGQLTQSAANPDNEAIRKYGMAFIEEKKAYWRPVKL